MNILAEIKDDYGFDEQRKCFVEILYKVRDWDKGWNNYFDTGKRPMNLSDFLDHLHELYEIQKRVPNDTAN